MTRSSIIISTLAATVVAYILGMLRHSPMLFGKIRMKEKGMTDKDMAKMKGKMMGKYVGHFVTMFLGTFVLGYVLVAMNATDRMTAFKATIILRFGFSVIKLSQAMIRENTSWTLRFLKVGYSLITYLAAAMVYVWMRKQAR